MGAGGRKELRDGEVRRGGFCGMQDAMQECDVNTFYRPCRPLLAGRTLTVRLRRLSIKKHAGHI